MPRQFDFLESFIHNVLDEAGFQEMTEATRAQFVPMFVAEAERRPGLALLRLLNDEQIKALADLAKNDEIDQKMMADFWIESVPNFEEVVQNTLEAFAEEFKKTLASVSK